MRSSDAIWLQALRIRQIEEFVQAQLPSGIIRCPVHLALGHEVVPCAVLSMLPPETRMWSNHRCHADYLAKGGDLAEMFGELLGRQGGCCKGRGGSMHLADPEHHFLGADGILGCGASLAVGSSFAAKLRGETWPSVVFGGDSVIEQGAFFEALHLSTLYRLPVIFVVQDNGIASGTLKSARRASGWNACRIASAIGIYNAQIDGTMPASIESVLRQMGRRRDAEPMLIEWRLEKLCSHVGWNEPMKQWPDHLETIRRENPDAIVTNEKEIESCWKEALTWPEAS